jgi:hypothetical protein
LTNLAIEIDLASYFVLWILPATLCFVDLADRLMLASFRSSVILLRGGVAVEPKTLPLIVA